jgi:hypothetical protein
MKYFFCFGLLLIVVMVLNSCKKELEPQNNSSVSGFENKENQGISPVTTGAARQNVLMKEENSNKNTTGLNPAHGQPGHRCDIAVGAPLNSLSTKKMSNQPLKTRGAAPAVLQSNSASIVTPPGMNPPHGQAGHRCDIAVGTPLNTLASKTNPLISNSDSILQIPKVLKMDSTTVITN